jgi:hypothetical protein
MPEAVSDDPKVSSFDLDTASQADCRTWAPKLSPAQSDGCALQNNVLRRLRSVCLLSHQMGSGSLLVNCRFAQRRSKLLLSSKGLRVAQLSS